VKARKKKNRNCWKGNTAEERSGRWGKRKKKKNRYTREPEGLT